MTEASNKIFADDVVEDVVSTWKNLSSDLQGVGFEIFERLFAAYPDYQQLFRAFKDVPSSELKNNEVYCRHALNVASALNTAIENLNDADILVPVLRGVGKAHVKRNVTPVHFSNAQEVVLEAITHALGDKADEKILSSWNEVLAVAVSTIMKGCEDEEAKYL